MNLDAGLKPHLAIGPHSLPPFPHPEKGCAVVPINPGCSIAVFRVDFSLGGTGEIKAYPLPYCKLRFRM